jgi:hypothetical protein
VQREPKAGVSKISSRPTIQSCDIYVHGGAVSVSSEPDAPTVFTIWLPAADVSEPSRTTN